MHPHVYNMMRNRALRAPEGAGGGGTGVASNPRPQQQQKPTVLKEDVGNEVDEENSSGDFSLDKGNIWEQPEGNGERTQDVTGKDADRQNGEAAVMEGFDAFVAKKNWKFELTPEDIQNFVEKGDSKGLAAALQKSQREMYRETMLDSSRMVNSAIDRAVDKAVQKATGNFQTDKAKDTLRRVVPLANNPNVAPIAEAIMSTFIKKGQSHADAASNVSKVFNAIRGVKGKDIGVDDPPRDRNGNRGGAAQNDDEDMIDWMSFARSND